jgi:radical SAM superfamily enzyme YgiQ (UPF0313 family)
MPRFLKEKNVLTKGLGKRFGFLFPSTYEIGMAGMTTIAIAHLVNQLPTWRCERFFLPWNPYVEATSLETGATLRDVDVIGFTSQFEQHYLSAGWLLKKANIPLDNRVRLAQAGKYPPIFVGGPCAMANPFPLLDFVDGFFLGDSEESLPQFLQFLGEKDIQSFWRDSSAFADIKGFWSPHFLEVNGDSPYSELFQDQTFEDIAGNWYEQFQFVDLNKAAYPLKQTLTDLPDYHPYAPVKGQTFQLELGRGCNHKCKFCMISRLLHKGRYRDYNDLVEIALEGTKTTGVSKVDIFGTNLSDYPQLADLCWELVNHDLQVSLATFRPDKVTAEIIEVLVKGGQTSLTIAPETGNDRLRTAVGKQISNEQILQATQVIFESGIQTLKDFFLVGLPAESDEDRTSILSLVKQQHQIAKNVDRKNILRVDINPVVPKWHTPLRSWLFYYLPQNRPKLKDILIGFYQELSRLDNIRPKETSLLDYLAQTWLTHITTPINPLLEKMPLNSHIPMTRNVGFYLYNNHATYFDSLLTQIWKDFVKDNWSIRHRIRASPYNDEFLTKEYLKVAGHRLS